MALAGDTKDWARNGSFMKKPAGGWLHDPAALQFGDGLYYAVIYVGSIRMEASIRTMRFEDRTAVTREAITLVCEKGRVITPHKRKPPRHIMEALPDDPFIKNLNVRLTISTTGIALVVNETYEVIANHIMPSISFATGLGEADYSIIGYVAKDHRNIREVHVFDCGELAPDVMTTIGQAFELRYKAFLGKGQANARGGRGGLPPGAPGMPCAAYCGDGPLYDQATGYGEIGGAPAVIYDTATGGRGSTGGGEGSVREEAAYDTAAGMSLEPDYDEAPLDMAPGLQQAPGARDLQRPIEQEIWFHGPLRRQEADALFQKNGDFLVRESVESRGQFVLSALQDGEPKHLLLVDPSGQVRIKDMAFDSVSHLINYHLRARLPIISKGSRITLGDPVPRPY